MRSFQKTKQVVPTVAVSPEQPSDPTEDEVTKFEETIGIYNDDLQKKKAEALKLFTDAVSENTKPVEKTSKYGKAIDLFATYKHILKRRIFGTYIYDYDLLNNEVHLTLTDKRAEDQEILKQSGFYDNVNDELILKPTQKIRQQVYWKWIKPFSKNLLIPVFQWGYKEGFFYLSGEQKRLIINNSLSNAFENANLKVSELQRLSNYEIDALLRLNIFKYVKIPKNDSFFIKAQNYDDAIAKILYWLVKSRYYKGFIKPNYNSNFEYLKQWFLKDSDSNYKQKIINESKIITKKKLGLTFKYEELLKYTKITIANERNVITQDLFDELLQDAIFGIYFGERKRYKSLDSEPSPTYDELIKNLLYLEFLEQLFVDMPTFKFGNNALGKTTKQLHEYVLDTNARLIEIIK